MTGDRTALVHGLIQLATFLQAHPEVPAHTSAQLPRLRPHHPAKGALSMDDTFTYYRCCTCGGTGLTDNDTCADCSGTGIETHGA